MRKRVIKQIEELLFRNEYVVVPGLGTFLRNIHSSEIDEAKGLIYPPKNSLSFNASLSQSDGILQQSYVRKFGISQKKADVLIREDVKDLLQILRSVGYLQVGSIGKMWINGNGKAEFAPDGNHPYTTYFFGYTPVVTLSGKGSNDLLSRDLPEKKSKDTVYLPVNLSFLKYGSVAAIFLLAFFLFPKVLTDKSLAPSETPQYQAGFLSTGVKDHVSNDAVKVAEPLKRAEARDALSSPSSERPTLAGLPLISPEKGNGTPMYYVVIATLRSEEAVQKFINENRPQDRLEGLSIVHTNRGSSTGGTYRIVSSVSDDKEKAEVLMKELHNSFPEYGDAWVYGYPLP